MNANEPKRGDYETLEGFLEAAADWQIARQLKRMGAARGPLESAPSAIAPSGQESSSCARRIHLE